LAVPIDVETNTVLFNKGLVSGVIENTPSKAAAIGHQPVILGAAVEFPMRCPRAEISMPLASNVLVSLHGVCGYRDLLPIDHTADLVNDGILMYSDTVATCSPEGTQKLRHRWHENPALEKLADSQGRMSSCKWKRNAAPGLPHWTNISTSTTMSGPIARWT